MTKEADVNLNDLARKITLREGGKVNLSIAQVKEVMRLLLIEMAAMAPIEALKVIWRYRKT
jgi:predicted DNA-binding antitoxin AbrB/MazE fold protein